MVQLPSMGRHMWFTMGATVVATAVAARAASRLWIHRPYTRERRNWSTRRELPFRVAAEYREMPGMTLTLEQACRLWSMGASACERVLTALVSEGVLRLADGGRYVRSEGLP